MFYLRRVRGHYYFRARVPKDLQGVIKRREIKSSLHTKCFRDAKASVKTFTYKLERIFTLARCGMLTDDEVADMIREFLGTELRVRDNDWLSGIGSAGRANVESSSTFDRHAEACSVEDGKGEAPIKLSFVVGLYGKEKADVWAYKTSMENESIFKTALEIIGDKDVRALSRSDFLAYRDVLKELPPHHSKKAEYRGKTIDQIIRIARKKGVRSITDKTRNKSLQGISSLMEWCVQQDYITKNYAKRLASKERKNPEEDRQPYSIDDIRKLLHSPLYTTDIPLRQPERFWVPLIGLFSGCRLNEICSLYLEDIKEEDGVQYFDINADTRDKSIKTQSSARRVPVHPTLAKIGLLHYVEGLRQRGERRLFPNLRYTKANGYCGAVGHWWNRYSKEHIAVNDKRKVFHSFRRTVANALKQNGVDYKQIEEILGHKDNSMSTGYYAEAFRLEILLAALKKLDDYGVDFSGVKYVEREYSI